MRLSSNPLSKSREAKQLTVVAEYVETEAQKAMLLALGVDYLQGYLIGKPQPLSELKA